MKMVMLPLLKLLAGSTPFQAILRFSSSTSRTTTSFILFYRPVRLLMIGCFLIIGTIPQVQIVEAALTASYSPGSSSSASGSKLLGLALSSPSGKLTVSPEIALFDPSDPTALLLQSNAVQTLSSRIREGKANAAFVRTASMTTLSTFCSEQNKFHSAIPGPVPVVYMMPPLKGPTTPTLEQMNGPDMANVDGIMSDIQAAGASGVLVPLAMDDEGNSVMTWQALCKAAWKCNIYPIPELTIGTQNTPDDIRSWIKKICEVTKVATSQKELQRPPSESTPVIMVLTVNSAEPVNNDSEWSLPSLSDLISKPKPENNNNIDPPVIVLGSVKVTPEEARDDENNWLHAKMLKFKKAGFRGVILRTECLPPGLQRSVEKNQRPQDLDIMGRFWAACVADLKSTKSRSFSFRAKNKMDKTDADKWGTYQQNVVESGALGDPKDLLSAMVDTETGDYKGF